MRKETLIAAIGNRPREIARWLTAALLILAACHYTSARADDWHLIVNGKAIHFDKKVGVHYNESNWGAGFQYDFGNKNDVWIPFVAASGFLDSNSNPSYYAGGGVMRRYFVTDDSRLHADIGAVAFFMTRKGFRDDKPFFGALPAFSFGGDTVSVNMTFIPRVDPKAVPLLFFQLKINLK
jgi:antimicrobial peptide resistance and lipid A acylation protein PagP